MYHIVSKILCNKFSDVELEIKVVGINWRTPSSSGKLFVVIGGLKENQTAREKGQWKNRWVSFSTAPQEEQCLSICVEYLAIRSAVASARLISLQENALISGGMSLLFHTLQNMVSMGEDTSGSLPCKCF